MRLSFAPLILLLALVAIIPMDADAYERLLDPVEVLDVADLDIDVFALLPWSEPEVVASDGVDNDCDGDARRPAVREPDHWRYLCDSTQALHRCLMVHRAYVHRVELDG